MSRFLDIQDPSEDWSGLKSSKERRKLQTRLNVRAHRRRLAEQSKNAYQAKIPKGSEAIGIAKGSQGMYELDSSARYLIAGGSSYARSFPLSPDHLITVVQWNLVRASVTNACIMSIMHQFRLDECGLGLEDIPQFPPFPPTYWQSANLSPDWEGIQRAPVPEALLPTALQLKAPHELWIDLLPDPTFRDNLIRALQGNEMSALEFRADIVGQVCAPKFKDHRRRMELERSLVNDQGKAWQPLGDEGEVGLLVWNDPWSPDGYEMSNAFLQKWSFLLKGCGKLLEATNRWRAIRGEEPLIADL